MSKVKPPRNLTPGLCQLVQREMLQACRDVAARHGLAIDDKGLTEVDLRLGFHWSLRVSIPMPDGTTLDPERLLFEAVAEAFGLSRSDFGREFTTDRHRFRITGLDPRRPKYPISAERLPDRQPFKFSAEQVLRALQGSMKDITPKD